jgi:hypothetical protein
MKKIRNLVLFAVMVSLGSLFLISCGTGGDDGGSPYSVLGVLSTAPEYSWITIVKNGSIDFSNFLMPITGEVVSTATVTLTNDTIGTSEVMPFSISDGGYGVPSSFPINVGDQLSVAIEIDGDTITGASTLVPNPQYSNLSPDMTFVILPFTASWEVSNTSFEATQTSFRIANQLMTKGYWAIMPISQTSIPVTSAEVSAGDYAMVVEGGNPMNLSGAASGSIIYTTGGILDSALITII